MLHTVLDFLFPRSSLTGREGNEVTPEELKRLTARPFLLHKYELRRRGMPHISMLCAAMMYREEPLLRKVLHRWKYKSVRSLDGVCSKLIVSASKHLPREPRVFCPIPLHWTRKFSRGFNQAHVLADALARSSQGMVMELLLRRRMTGHQAHRSGSERRQSMGDVFAVAFQSFVPEKVTLVDDVCTTGATLEEAAKTLIQNGVREVEVIVIALD